MVPAARIAPPSLALIQHSNRVSASTGLRRWENGADAIDRKIADHHYDRHHFKLSILSDDEV
jgi:hypothetical protein